MDKLALIKKILTTDPETDREIMTLIEAAEGKIKPGIQVQAASDHKDKIHIEERACQRKSLALNTAINTGKEKIRAQTEDVSVTGAFIRTDQKISEGRDIAIRLMTSDGEAFSFLSRVIRVEDQGIGVEIKTISPDHQKRFTEFVKKLK